jgi:biotin carboxylase
VSDTRPEAVILTGSFYVICRNPRYLTDLTARGLTILAITPAAWRDQALACMAEPGHPAAAIDDVVFVPGELSVEGAYVPGAVAAAQQWQRRYRIVGVLSAGETVVEGSGLLADALGLPSPGLRATRACRYKYLQRWYLPEFSPPSVLVAPTERDSFDRSGVEFPVVVKPTGRHSSSGVVAVADAAQLREEIAGYPPHETLLIEKRVIGQEYSVESLVQNSRLIFASVTRKETTESDDRTFVELAHSVPVADRAVDDVLRAANQRMLELLDFGDGIAHSEWRLSATGRPYLMEVACRTPGGGLMVLYQLATGAPLEPEVVRIALGEPAAYPVPRRYTRQVYLQHPSGILDDVTVDWPGVEATWIGPDGTWPDFPAGAADEPPTLRAVVVLKERGSELGPMRSGDDRTVTFFIDAATPDELDELEQRVRGAVKVHTGLPAEPA